MKERNNNFITHKIIIIIVLLGLIMGALVYQLRLAGEGETTITAKELKGQIVDITHETISLRDDNNIVYTVDCQKAKIKGDELQYGNLVTIKYTGKLEQTTAIQAIDVLGLNVQAVQVRNGGTGNTDATIASHKIAVMVEKMTLEQKIAQLFLARCPESQAVELLSQHQLGGYMLYNRDFHNRTREEVIENIQSYQKAVTIPMLIAVDEEGGTVVRVSNNLRSNKFRSPQDVFKAGGMDAIISDATEKSEFLKEFGINVNIGPVADVAMSKDDFIYQRSFGTDPNETAEFVKNVVKAMNDIKMGSVLKHFPGYGNVADNHTAICHDSRDYDSLVNNDFLPFKAGISAGANSILISHIVVDSIDDQNLASLSPRVSKILRDDLNYHGVIIADDISMASAKAFGSEGEVALKAIKAGNDLIMTSNPQEHISALIAAAKNDEICLNSLDRSVMRILTWKSQLGIL